MSILKQIRGNKTLIDGGLFSLFSFFNRGISFLLLILLANYITPAEYGQLSLFNTVVMFLSYFVGLSTAGYLSISYFQSSRESFNKDFSVICIITLGSFLFFSTIFVLFNNSIASILKIEPTFLYLALAISFCTVFVQLNLDYLRVQEKVSLYGVLCCSFALFNFVLSLYLVISEGLSWKGRVFAQVICDILFMIIAIIWFAKDRLYTLSCEKSRIKTIILWGIPLIPHLASSWVKQGCDRYIIENSHSMDDVGLFSFALNLMSVIIMIGSAFNNTTSVSLFKTLSSELNPVEKRNKLRHQEKMMSYIYIIATAVIAVCAIIIVPIVMPQYSGSIKYFTILSISGFIQCLYYLYCNYLFYFKKTQNLMYITFGTSVLHLLLSLFFTKYSLIYTSVIYVISISIIVILVRRKANRLIEEHIN